MTRLMLLLNVIMAEGEGLDHMTSEAMRFCFGL